MGAVEPMAIFFNKSKGNSNAILFGGYADFLDDFAIRGNCNLLVVRSFEICAIEALEKGFPKQNYIGGCCLLLHGI